MKHLILNLLNEASDSRFEVLKQRGIKVKSL